MGTPRYDAGEFERGTFTVAPLSGKRAGKYSARIHSWALEANSFRVIVSRELANLFAWVRLIPLRQRTNTFLSVLVEQGCSASRFLRNAGRPRFIAQGLCRLPSAALDCLARGLDRRRLQLDMGNAQNPPGSSSAFDGAMRKKFLRCSVMLGHSRARALTQFPIQPALWDLEFPRGNPMVFFS